MSKRDTFVDVLSKSQPFKVELIKYVSLLTSGNTIYVQWMVCHSQNVQP